MRQRRYVFITAMLISGFFLGVDTSVTYAQTTINAANFNPVVGDVFTGYSFSDTLSTLGGSGPNQVWDYQNLMPGANTFNVSYIATNQGQAAACFTTANLLVKNGTIENYYRVDAIGLQNVGHSIGAASGDFISGNRYEYKYPLTLNSNVTNAYDQDQINCSTGSIDYKSKGSINFHVVGSGTLKLPSGTFHNVLKVIRTSWDTTYTTSPVVAVAGIVKSVSTQWLYPGIHQPILMSTVSKDPTVTQPFLSYRYLNVTPLALNEIVKNKYSFTIFPNPVLNNLNINIELLAKSDVNVNILTIGGQMVNAGTQRSLEKGKNNIPVSVETLASGMYMVNVIVSGVHIYQQFIKK